MINSTYLEEGSNELHCPRKGSLVLRMSGRVQLFSSAKSLFRLSMKFIAEPPYY